MVRGEDDSKDQLVVTFHGIGPAPHWVPAEERPFWCPEPLFQRLLDDIMEVAGAPGPPVVLAFDDGNESDVSVVLPALVDRGVSASFYVCAGRLGQRGYLDPQGVKELVGAGMSIGSHGWSHIDWRLADSSSMRRELEEARDVLQQVSGVPISEVAVPFGSYDRHVLSLLRRANYKTVYTSDRGISNHEGWRVARETFETGCAPGQWVFDIRRPGSVGVRLRRRLAQVVKGLR